MAPHILVVEDSELVTSAFKILLEDAGYVVTDAATIDSAVAAARANPVDVMLLDLTLPDGDGLLALARMRECGTLPRITLAMTGDDKAETRRRCLDSGCSEVLIKPVSIRELRDTISRYLAESSGRLRNDAPESAG